MVDDLEEVVFGVLKDHEDTLALEDDFDEVDKGRVREFSAKCHLADGRL